MDQSKTHHLRGVIMKKFFLILSVTVIWGCSQADDTDVKDQAKAEVAAVQEAVKTEVAKQTNEAVEQAVDQVVQTVNEQTTAVAQQVSETAKFQPGIHYQVINPAWDTGTEKEVVVYEFFGYLCPHCASFQPYMHKLESQLPDNAKLVRIPVVFRADWKPYAQAYYTIEAMGLVDKVHEAMFAAIHQHKRQFRTIEEIAVWMASSFGVNKDEFLSTAKSFMVDGQIRKGMQMLQAMGVTSTPTLVTNGKFKPNNKALKSRDEIIDITAFLINQEAKTMGL